MKSSDQNIAVGGEAFASGTSKKAEPKSILNLNGNGADDAAGYDVARRLNGPISQAVPDSEKIREHRVFVEGADKEAKVAISAYKSLRTQTLQRMDELGTNSLMITGSTQNVGKTLTSINLAIAFSRRSGKRVVLVDMDLRSPSIHNVLGIKSKGSIVDVAERRKPLNEVLINPQIPNLLVLPGKDRIEHSSEVLVAPNMRRLLEEFQQQEDTLFVFDTPPVLGCDDVPSVGPSIGACLFVVSERSSLQGELDASLRIIDDSVNIIGITINRSSEGNFGAYYY